MYKFVSKISKMGENRIIWIPKALLKMVEGYENRHVIVTVNELVEQKDDTGNRKKIKKNNNKQR